jgi:predicted RNA-binding Zn-ribbon protein involved in translation (DUF1610 family)
MIPIRYTTFNCPHCGKHWTDRLVSSPAVGPEWVTCKKCKTPFRTPDIEWDHMARGEKAAYLFRETTIACLIFCGIFLAAGLAMALDSAYSKQEQREGAVWVIGITIVMLLPSTVGKWWAIRRSQRRVAASHEKKQEESLVVTSSR